MCLSRFFPWKGTEKNRSSTSLGASVPSLYESSRFGLHVFAVGLQSAHAMVPSRICWVASLVLLCSLVASRPAMRGEPLGCLYIPAVSAFAAPVAEGEAGSVFLAASQRESSVHAASYFICFVFLSPLVSPRPVSLV